LSASYAKVPPVNVVEPQVAVTLLAASETSALNFLAVSAGTLQTATHPPAKALALVNEKKTDCPSILVESELEVAEHSLMAAVLNKAVVNKSFAVSFKV